MGTITEKRLYSIVDIIETQCRKLELITETETLELTIGSKYFGNSFSIYAFDADKSEKRARHLYFGNYLGMTKKEADLSLCGIRDALAAVIYSPTYSHDRTGGIHVK